MNNLEMGLPYSYNAGRMQFDSAHVVTEQLKAGAKLAFVRNGDFKLVVNSEHNISVKNGHQRRLLRAE